MHIQKSSAYSTVVSALLRHGTPGADREPNRQVLPASNHAGSGQNDSLPLAAEIDSNLAQAGHDRIKNHSSYGLTLLELNPKLDRRTQTAIDSYEMLQAHSDAEERELVSRLLGIDLYV